MKAKFLEALRGCVHIPLLAAVSACAAPTMVSGTLIGTADAVLQVRNPTAEIGVQLQLDLVNGDKEPSFVNNDGQLRSLSTLDAEQIEVLGIVGSTARKHEIDPLDFAAVAWIESKFRPNAKNPNSTASGVMQFVLSTANAYGLADPFDPHANLDAGARLWKDNAYILQLGLGRKPTGAEMYLAHQQGADGALRLLRSVGDASSLVGDAAIALNGGDAATSAQQFVAHWTAKFNKARARFVIH